MTITKLSVAQINLACITELMDGVTIIITVQFIGLVGPRVDAKQKKKKKKKKIVEIIIC